MRANLKKKFPMVILCVILFVKQWYLCLLDIFYLFCRSK